VGDLWYKNPRKWRPVYLNVFDPNTFRIKSKDLQLKPTCFLLLLIANLLLLLFNKFYVIIKVSKIFQKYTRHPKILGTGSVTWRKSHGEDPQIFDVVVRNSVPMATLRPEFVALSYHRRHNHQVIVLQLFVMFTELGKLTDPLTNRILLATISDTLSLRNNPVRSKWIIKSPFFTTVRQTAYLYKLFYLIFVKYKPFWKRSLV
jgi:hypothetical protein